MNFEIIGEIETVEVIAAGKSIRDRARLNKVYGAGRWRKLKGIARVRLQGGRIRLAELHWYEAHGIGKKGHQTKAVPGLMRGMRRKDSTPRFVVCINNSDYEASLELHKIYPGVGDFDAAQDGDLRIVDESGEDYLYAASRFVAIAVPKALERAMFEKAS